MKYGLRTFVLFLVIAIIAHVNMSFLCAQTGANKNIKMDVYIENSFSMDGYVEGVMTPFKKNIYNFILYSGVPSENLKLYYVNSNIIPQKSNDLRSFILNLTPQSFKTKGGERKSSDIAKVVSNVLKKVSVHKQKSPENNTDTYEQITVLVSDFIFSPGKKNRDNINDYLEFQEEDVKNSISKMLKENSDYALAFLQGKSPFNGWYYNVEDKIFDFTKDNVVKRPYYLMIVGPSSAVASVFNSVKDHATFENTYIAVSDSEKADVNINVLDIKAAFPKEQVGWDYYVKTNKDKTTSQHITDAELDRNKVLKFAILADFSKLPLPFSYLSNPKNYEFQPDGYEVESVTPEKNGNYTHRLIIRNKHKKIMDAKPLKIKLGKNIEWVSEATEKDKDGKGEGWIVGKKINSEKLSEIENTTFGLKSFIDGIEKAYDEHGNAEYYSKDFEIKIER